MADDAAASPEYERMMLLEDLESLREEMDEAGVSNLEEVERWLHAPAADRAHGVPSRADLATLRAIHESLTEYSITTLTDLEERIAALHAELDAVG